MPPCYHPYRAVCWNPANDAIQCHACGETLVQGRVLRHLKQELAASATATPLLAAWASAPAPGESSRIERYRSILAGLTSWAYVEQCDRYVNDSIEQPLFAAGIPVRVPLSNGAWLAVAPRPDGGADFAMDGVIGTVAGPTVVNLVGRADSFNVRSVVKALTPPPGPPQ